MAVAWRELLPAQPCGSDHDQRRGRTGQAARSDCRARQGARRRGEAGPHHDRRRGWSETHAHRRDDGKPGALLGVYAPAGVLVGGHRPRLLLWICGHDGETDVTGSSALCVPLHRWQAARHRRADLSGDAQGDQTDGSRTHRRRNTVMRARMALVGVALMAGVSHNAGALRRMSPSATMVVAPDPATTTKFDVNGVSVILRRNIATEVVVASLYLLGGTRQLTPATAGIEAMVLATSERVTRHFPGAGVRQRTARLGSTISIEASDDWSAIGLHAIRATFDSTWAIFADRVMAPTLDPNEFALMRDQFLTIAREKNTQPDDAATELADSLLYLNHPNSVSPTGTPESISAITVAQLKQYHAQQFVTSRMLLVVVGNVDRAQVERLVRTTLSTMPRGTYKWTSPPTVTTTGRALAIDNRLLPTNYLLGYVPGPAATDPDYTALRVATAGP